MSDKKASVLERRFLSLAVLLGMGYVIWDVLEGDLVQAILHAVGTGAIAYGFVRGREFPILLGTAIFLVIMLVDLLN